MSGEKQRSVESIDECSQEKQPHDTRSNPRPVRSSRSDGIRRGRRRRGTGRPGHGHPPEAARPGARARGLGGRAREGLGARRAHPLRRDHGPARPDRAAAELEGGRRAAQPAGHRRPLPLPHRDRRQGARPTSSCPTASRTTATTSSAWATWSSGWRRRPRRSASRSSPAFRPPRCSTPRTARSRAWPPATWASARTASRPTSFQLGMELHGKYTIFAEGSRGSLGRQLISRFSLDAGQGPAELRHRRQGAVGGRSVEGRARPRGPHRRLAARSDTYGGSFLYHLDNNQVELGFVVGLDYANPWLSPFEEMQRWKTHPEIRKTLEGGKRLGYGARAITAGGILSLPKTVFPGGAFVGCEAGYLNASRIKGSHAAIKTGMLAAEAAFEALVAGRSGDELAAYPGRVREELAARRARPLAQLQAVVQEGPHHRDADDRHRAVAAAQARLQGAALDAAPRQGRPPLPEAGGRVRARSSIPSPTTCSPSTACRACSSATPTIPRTSRRT